MIAERRYSESVESAPPILHVWSYELLERGLLDGTIDPFTGRLYPYHNEDEGSPFITVTPNLESGLHIATSARDKFFIYPGERVSYTNGYFDVLQRPEEYKSVISRSISLCLLDVNTDLAVSAEPVAGVDTNGVRMLGRVERRNIGRGILYVEGGHAFLLIDHEHGMPTGLLIRPQIGQTHIALWMLKQSLQLDDGFSEVVKAEIRNACARLGYQLDDYWRRALELTA